MLTDLVSTGLNWAANHVDSIFVLVGLVLFLSWLQLLLIDCWGPHDLNGNGITVGQAKVFDTRSLTLMLEHFNSSLARLQMVQDDFGRRLDKLQGQSWTEESRATRAQIRNTGESGKDAADRRSVSERASTSPTDSKSSFAVAAADSLAERTNLQHQVLNLQLLNERALSDRLHGQGPRLQAVLGFQISLNPPNDARGSVAVVEIELRPAQPGESLSLVALVPQAKTYNQATVSSRSDSLDGSLVSQIASLGYSGSHRERDLFLHQDADTIAFERDYRSQAWPFRVEMREPSGDPPLVFGWEFRPVLGRRSVSPGIRQMLAVVALPRADAEDNAGGPGALRVKVRTHWRAYKRGSTTTSLKWGWGPLLDRSRSVQMQEYTVQVPLTSAVQRDLAPRVTDITWTDVGQSKALVLLKGHNFFSGTEITVGGITHRDSATGLSVKSDQALDIHTTVDALIEGDAVLSGRYGSSIPLRLDMSTWSDDLRTRLQQGIAIHSAHIESGSGRSFSHLDAVIEARSGRAIRIEDLEKLPTPLLFINGHFVRPPYDYLDALPKLDEHQQLILDAGGNPVFMGLRVQAWVPSSFSPDPHAVLIFKIPFCGDQWVVNTVVPISEQRRVEYVGGNKRKTLLISSTSPFTGDWSVELDRTYTLSGHTLRNVGGSLMLEVGASVMRHYRKLVLRSAGAQGEQIVLDLPPVASVNGVVVEPARPTTGRRRNRRSIQRDQPEPPAA